ncbi:MAG: insulinase family protein [Bacteroidales bacterium]|nr:insulinase family protein [Bacteroidales bacterium]
MNRTGRKLVLPGLLIIFFSFTAFAQNSGDAIPTDPEIRMGKLDNGMSYYIRQNHEPEKRASFYIIQNVGALLENENQNGLAHFLEHMAFNGTRHFPSKEKRIISTLEKHGVAFGYNINAYTAFNETVYNLSDVPVDHPGLLDTCLLVLNDWSNYLLLTEEEIDAERGVITEEWRTRRTAQFRLNWQFIPVLLEGSKYAERDIIGDLDIIQNFDYNTLRDFYHKWYRTDLQAIAVVGDFDPGVMEKKVIELFSQIPAVEDPPVRPFFEVPEHDNMRYVLATDREASQHSVDLYIKHRAIDPADKNREYLREQYIRTLFNSMMSERIDELLQKGTPPFIMGSVSYSSFVRGYDVFSIGASFRQGEGKKAFEAIYAETERVKRHGFTGGELERAKAKMLSDWDNYYKERDKIDNDSYAGSIQQHFLINEPLPSVEYEYNKVKEIVPGISPGEVSSRAEQWMTGKNRVLVVQGPEGDSIDYLTENQALAVIENIENSDLTAYDDTGSAESLINNTLPGSEVTNARNLPGFDAFEWTLGNGARVIYRKADYEKDNVSVNAFSFGGTSLVEDSYIPEAALLPTLAAMYGAGEFDNIALQKMLSGKKASLSVSLSEVTENISGTATPKDFETLMQLLYLRFEKPRFDREAHDALTTRFKALLETMNNNPQKIMQDSLTRIMSGYHPRARILNEEYIDDIEFEKIRELYLERFRDADDYTFFIVGNVEEDTAKMMAEKYIGSLTSYPGSDQWIDRGIRQPEGKIEKIIEMLLAVPKATIVISFSEDMEFNPYNRQAARAVNGILDIIFTEKIREEEGGTYGVSAAISLQQFPVQKANTIISFDCDPERANQLKSIVYHELQQLMENGPEKEYLDKAVNNILKNREESKQHNSYWMSVLYTYYLSGINYNDPANYEEILKGFTPEDIKEAAIAFFKDADVVDIIFTPEQGGE